MECLLECAEVTGVNVDPQLNPKPLQVQLEIVLDDEVDQDGFVPNTGNRSSVYRVTHECSVGFHLVDRPSQLHKHVYLDMWCENGEC